MDPVSPSPSTVTLPNGPRVPALGQGTWNMGERPDARRDEVRALQEGIDLGLTVLDTAEMYASGGSERVVGEAIAGRRASVFLVSKVLPSHAGEDAVVAACRGSLERLGTDHLDLYLLHWRSGTALEETLAGFARLQAEGSIRAWGVSNFDAGDLAELVTLPGGEAVATNQVLYNLTRRWPEPELLPAQRERGIPTMAYSPVEQGRLIGHAALTQIAARHDASAAQVALAWLLRQGDVLAIPKASRLEHVRDNHRALDLVLDPDDLAALDASFPPPTGRPAMELL